MKKVLIISFYFPPCNLTASQRAYDWAKNFKHFNIDPIILTRNWDISIKEPKDVHLKSGTEKTYTQNKEFKAVILPYKASFYDQLILTNKLPLFQKTVTLIRKLSVFKPILLNPYNEFYKEAARIIKNENISGIIVTGAPFELFYIGYKLNKKYNIPWIADYRDDWSTNEVLKYNIVEKILLKFNKFCEKKWIKRSSCITSISKHYTKKISIFTKKSGYVIENGFNEYISNPHTQNDLFTIIYNGTLYKSQPVEIFLEAFCEFSKDKDNVELKFIGAGYDLSQKNRLLKYKSRLNNKLIVTNRIERKEVIEEQKKASLLLMISHQNCKGIPSSKLYEYFSLGKNILSFPPDFDILDEKLNEYELGKICSNQVEIINYLNKLYDDYSQEKLLKIETPNENYFISRHFRYNQTKQMSEICKKYF